MRARKGRFASWVGDNDKNDHTTNDNDKIAEKKKSYTSKLEIAEL